MSPEPEVTPASPTPQIPVERSSLEPADTTTIPSSSKNESKETPKVIPLERDPRQFMRTKPAIEKQQQKFDIRAPKDWHRGLRGHQPSSSASPRYDFT